MTTQPLTLYGIFTDDGLDGIEMTKGSATKSKAWLTKRGHEVRLVVCQGAEAEAFLDALNEACRDAGRNVTKASVMRHLRMFPTVTIVKG